MTEENNNTPVENVVINTEAETAMNEHKNLRAFFVSFATSKEEFQAIKEGKSAPSGFIPLFAENEQIAASFLQDQIQNNGLLVLGFEPLEILEMKTFMLRNIAEKNGINVQRQKMFDGRLLLAEHNPVQLYAAPAPTSTEVSEPEA